MKVVSKLVELDFDVYRIDSHKAGIVVSNDPTKSMATKVQITPEDAMTIARAVLTSGPAMKFMLTFPFVAVYRRMAGKNQPKRGGK